MKPNPALNPQVISVDAYAKTRGKIRYFYPKKSKKPKAMLPPDEASCLRLNAIAKEYPFCVYYREKNHDPL
jgi:hypothetical protein